MGYLRKGAFVATGGLSGLVVKANSKKERTAKASEKQLALQRAAASAQQQAATAAQRAAEERECQAKIAAGAWWLEDGAVATIKRFPRVSYLGGWPGHLDQHTGDDAKYLLCNAEGLKFRGRTKTLFTIPWDRVRAIEAVETAAAPVPAAAVAEELEGRWAKEHAVLVLTFDGGAKASFLIPKVSPPELASRLAPVAERLAEGAKRAQRLEAPAVGPVASVADELTKLAALRDSGVLTEEEFGQQKARLLGRV